MPKKHDARSPSLTSQESYKAVIIADLVAEVPEEPRCEPKHAAKPAAAAAAKSSAAVVNVDSIETVMVLTKVNGSDISKGVILNAVQFTQSDPKSKEPEFKPCITDAFTPQETTETEEEIPKKSLKEEFSEMSLLRKMAFGVSFLPSIMFVLCFSVIFPCEKMLPCVKEEWSINCNHSEIISKLQIPQNVLFLYSRETETGVQSISKSTGEVEWDVKLSAPTKFFECGSLSQADSQSCLTMEENGTMHLFNASNGNQLWALELMDNEIPSTPIIVPDCDDDGVDEIALAVSKTKIKVIYLGKIISFVEVFGCDSIPSYLFTWKRDKGADIVFICQKGQKEILTKIPQNKWCIYDKKNTGKTTTLLSTEPGILTQAKILPTKTGMYIWYENNLKKIDKDGVQQWAISNLNHSAKNQFLFLGNVSNQESQVLLYSSDIGNTFQITMIDPESGNVTALKTLSSIEMTEAILIHGEKRDFILSNRRKIFKSLTSQAVTKINEVSSAINMLTEEEVSLMTNESSSIEEEIAITAFDGSYIQILESQTSAYSKENSNSTFAVHSIEKKDKGIKLEVYHLKKSNENSTIQKITVSNWDPSSGSIPQCAWK